LTAVRGVGGCRDPGNVELLMPVMDYAGMAMIHCHIIEHEDVGMMGGM
jgi:FtsP/CotA-like multicopper oxidase with cupredoxin domain